MNLEQSFNPYNSKIHTLIQQRLVNGSFQEPDGQADEQNLGGGVNVLDL
jgi:hypothetical protein